MSSQLPEASPQLFFDTVNAHQRTAAIKAAIELDFFTALAEGNDTAASLADKSYCRKFIHPMPITARW